MPRRKKARRCRRFRGPDSFKPSGVPLRNLPQLDLHLDELEAIRLSDLEGLDQSEAAERMEISRGTLQRLLYSGRRKVADALINGKGLQVNRPNYINEHEDTTD